MDSEEITKEYQAGKTLYELSKELKINFSELKRIIEEVGIVYRAPKMLKSNLIGQTFTKLTVIEQSDCAECKRWVCRCSCENEIFVKTARLINKHTQSCGCLMYDKREFDQSKRKRNYHPQEFSARRIWYRRYNDPENGDYLSFEDFLTLSQQDCFYCGAPPGNYQNLFLNDEKASKFAKEVGGFTYSGLDRVDNSLPHTKENCVACCKTCNYAKRDRSLGDFYQWIYNLKDNKYKEFSEYQLILEQQSKVYDQRIKDFLDSLEVPEPEPVWRQILGPYYKFPDIQKKPGVKQDLIGKQFYLLTVLGLSDTQIKNVQSWKCWCLCGNIHDVKGNYLITKQVKSCGCLNRKQRTFNYKKAVKSIKKLPPEFMTAKGIFYSRYADGDLTLKDFYILSQLDCFYCGSKPVCSGNGYGENNAAATVAAGTFNFNGLDRVDNSQKHNINNLVPSCKHCNYAKRDLSFDDFLNWIERLKI